MWDYDPNDANTLWPKGFYKGQIFETHISDRPNGKGKMLEVVWKVWNGKQTQLLSEYFVKEPVSTGRYKRLAKALGASEDFKAGKFYAGDYIESAAVLCLTVETSEEYGDKNKVAGHEASDWRPSDDHYAKGWQAPDFRELKASDFNNAAVA